MESSSKKRRLIAPKQEPADEQVPFQQRFDSGYPAALMGDAPPSQPQNATNNDYERFAQQLQDAASFAQAQPGENEFPYTSVNVLLLRWEEDLIAESEIQALEKLFHERYNYRTEKWSIPSCSDPTIRFSQKLRSEIEQVRDGELLILYYAGHTSTDTDDQIYWASDTRDGSARLGWDTVRTLVENAQPDILLLLDACTNSDAPAKGSNGIKQGVAASGRESSLAEHNGPSFTYNLIDALHNLSSGPPFEVTKLHEELVTLRHQRSMDNSTISNGNGEPAILTERMPVFFTLNSEPIQSRIMLAPLIHMGDDPNMFQSNGDVPEPLHSGSLLSDPPPEPVFDDLRALVSHIFMGDPVIDIAAFKTYILSHPDSSGNVHIEGIFYGPQTIMLLSLPINVWNSFSDDRMLVFLGYIKSHNVATESQLLSEFAAFGPTEAFKHLEHGKILPDAREVAATSPTMIRHSPQQQPSVMMYPPVPHTASMIDPMMSPDDRKGEVQDSAEMHEAAIQLKALSHVRSHGHEDHMQRRNDLQHHEDLAIFGGKREGSYSSHGAMGDGMDSLYSPGDFNTQPARPKANRRTIQKSGPKQDTRCSLCPNAAPFKDSSSLRKHVLSAHTRPFPCAFAFAGCMSTFGSKNEWKRHITSQHLCLNFYRCKACPTPADEGKSNEFNRKDLFTQHLRRMHAPFAIKKAKGDNKLSSEWEAHVKEMQATCLITRRQPPQRSACPKADCNQLFEGAASWDDWTEHVGRHMEKGEAKQLGIDRYLAQWALDEGIIELKDNGEYHLCGVDKESQPTGYYSDATPRQQLEESRLEEQSMVDHAIDHMLEG